MVRTFSLGVFVIFKYVQVRRVRNLCPFQKHQPPRLTPLVVRCVDDGSVHGGCVSNSQQKSKYSLKDKFR